MTFEYDPPKGEWSREELGEIKNLSRYGPVVMAGQPSKGELRELKKRHGLKTVINLRMEEEIPFDERGFVEGELGLRYVHIPFNSPETMTDEALDEARNWLNDPNHRPVLLHCASANRVGAVWYVHGLLDRGLGKFIALERAVDVGLKASALQDRGLEYAEKTRKAKGEPPLEN